jgi:hypothetical protein
MFIAREVDREMDLLLRKENRKRGPNGLITEANGQRLSREQRARMASIKESSRQTWEAWAEREGTGVAGNVAGWKKPNSSKSKKKNMAAAITGGGTGTAPTAAPAEEATKQVPAVSPQAPTSAQTPPRPAVPSAPAPTATDSATSDQEDDSMADLMLLAQMQNPKTSKIAYSNTAANYKSTTPLSGAGKSGQVGGGGAKSDSTTTGRNRRNPDNLVPAQKSVPDEPVGKEPARGEPVRGGNSARTGGQRD